MGLSVVLFVYFNIKHILNVYVLVREYLVVHSACKPQILMTSSKIDTFCISYFSVFVINAMI